MDNYKTIKELADELNVTKQNIRYHIKFLPHDLPVKKIDGQIILDLNQQYYIIDRIKKTSGKRLVKRDVDFTSKENLGSKNNFNSKFNIVLMEKEDQIKDLRTNRDKQLAAKDEQIKDLIEIQKQTQNLLNQQQQLTLQSNKQIEALQQQLLLSNQRDEKEEETSDTKETPEEQSESLEETVHEKIKSESKKWWQLWK